MISFTKRIFSAAAFLFFIFFLDAKINAQDFKCSDCHENVIQKSVHDGVIGCQDCHVDIKDESHIEKKNYKKVKCETCHEEYADLVKSDIHHRLKGKVKNPPDCKVCHGTHQITAPPKDNVLKVKEICSKCHTSMVLANPYHSKAVEGNKCIGCHKQNGYTKLSQSVHKNLECADCHNFISNNLANHPKNVGATQKADCYLCHSAIAKEHRESIHGISLSEGVDEAAMCWNCHGSHDIQKVADPRSKVYPTNLAKTCGTCHDNPGIVKKFSIPIKNPGVLYSNSVHGKLISKGSKNAPTCVVCHGVHDIKNRIQPGSKISAFNVPQTCGQCHKEIENEYEQSIHWIRVKQGIREAPVCNNCHSEHGMQPVNNRVEAKKLQQQTCIVCHQNPEIAQRFGITGGQVKQYEDSYHGMAVMRGDKEAAMCVDCHGVHKILPKDHPESSVNPANITTTCKKCHANATETFSQSYSHQAATKTASKVEDIVATIYFWLIISVIGGMILHNLLIFIYEIRKKYRREKGEITIPRFTKNEVIQHLLLLISFITLAVTGFALKFHDSWWAEILRAVGLTETVRQNVHRTAAVVMIAVGIYHIFYLIFTPRGREVLINMIPKFNDITEARDNILYYLKLKKQKPRFDTYDYTEKAEYWALIWGTIVMGLTGFILWFPTVVGDWAPVWLIKVSELVHFYEAILATLAILVWHWFFVIFHPHEYPMSVTWINGRMSLENYRHHHEKHFRRVVLEWKEYRGGTRDIKKVSNSTLLFTSTLEKNGLGPDLIIQNEIDGDPELRTWIEEKMNPKAEKN
ncbi:MAG: cytochrome c3 family protein [Bacteroidetes bacterium]|nr:cytochrome c3 family protein [Bacteroidota bacterium]